MRVYVPSLFRFGLRKLTARRYQAGLGAGLFLFCRLTGSAVVPGVSAEALQPHSGHNPGTLFADAPPSATGINTTNDYNDPRMWAERFHEYGVGEIGTGVAVGDYDNDGRADIFVVSKVGTCRLFHNLGGWKFADVTESAGVGDFSGEWKQGVSFADVNNDGWLDIYVCRFGAPNLLFINQRDGTFREEAKARGLAVMDACGMAAFGDYDRDGWLDVYIHTNLLDTAAHPNGQRDYLFHNNRDGTFADVTDKAGIGGETQGHSATWWDEDEDGWPDVYVANDFGAPDFLYRNNRDGTFSKVTGRVLPHTAGTSMGADLGDVDNDGHMDFMVADMAATTREKDQRGMADTRGRNADFKSNDATTAPQVPRNALYLGTGTGHFREAALMAGIAATDWTWSVRFEDLDNDGRLDLYVTNGMDREQTNVDLIANMMRAETAQERVRLMKKSPTLSETHLAYRNLGDLRFEEVGAAWGLNQRGIAFGAAFGDFDGDGDLDLVYTNFQQGVTVLRNDCPTGHRIMVALRGTASNRFGIGAVVRIFTAAGEQMRQLALARGYLSSSEPVIHFGLGDATRIDRMVIFWPNGKLQEIRDLAADMKYTLTEPAEETKNVRLEHGGRSAMFSEVGESMGLSLLSREEPLEGTVNQPLLPIRFNRRGPGIAVGDMDGDGADEVVIGATTRDATRVLHRKGKKYESMAIPAIARAPRINAGPLLIADVTGGAQSDLLLTMGGAALPAEEPEYEPTLVVHDANGEMQNAPQGTLPSLPASVGAAVSADYDHDGRLDLFIGARVSPGFFPETPRSALWQNQVGKLVDVTDRVAPGLSTVGMVASALWSDVDGDGWVDLVVALDWGGVRYFHNNQGRGFVDWSAPAGFAGAGRGMWTGLASADFNGDGRPDFVAGNAGLNTPFQASSKYPETLYAADFNGSGSPQLVSAYYENQRLAPRASRRELAAVMPDILKRFPRNDDYARASFEEVVEKKRLDGATCLTVSELRSGVFLSRPDGTYRFVPLPGIAQIAPLQGVVAGDFDGDGKADIYAVQNSYEPSPALGRFDGGLSQFLRGDGRGNFTAVEPADSNLLVPGDAKALAVVDLDDDGWPDFFVTRNNDTTLAFRNNGAGNGRRMFGVKLRGPAGNPSAFGARVALELTDGSVEMTEVFGGGGFASQSSATCFLGYLENNLPVRIRVRWPDGSLSEHPFPAEATTLKLIQPTR